MSVIRLLLFVLASAIAIYSQAGLYAISYAINAINDLGLSFLSTFTRLMSVFVVCFLNLLNFHLSMTTISLLLTIFL